MTTERNAPGSGADIEARPWAQPTVYDQMDAQRLGALRAARLKGLTDPEVAVVLELAAKYDLDPFANEIWGTRGDRADGSKGQLLIMVGRNGLRKIAMRQGMKIKGSAIRQKDTFRAWLDEKTDEWRVEHAMSGVGGAERGSVIGAWADVREVGTRAQRGFYIAPLEEYLPTSEAKLKHSPWASQRSVMILAAAERMALGMATPLSGILVEGEDTARQYDVDASAVEETPAVAAEMRERFGELKPADPNLSAAREAGVEEVRVYRSALADRYAELEDARSARDEEAVSVALDNIDGLRGEMIERGIDPDDDDA